MLRLLVPLLILAASCSDAPDIPRLPPVSIGSGRVKLMTDAKTPAEAYDLAFTKITGCHVRVRTGLGGSEAKNYLDASAALSEVAESLKTMQALVTEEAKEGYLPYIARYEGLALDVSRHRIPASWQTRIDQDEREIKSQFSTKTAPIVRDWPPGLRPEKEPAAEPGKPADPPPPPPVKTPDVPFRLAFKAWKQSHTDLVDLFTAGKDCKQAYSDILNALSAMKEGIPAARQPKLGLMISVYEQQHEETKGFTAIPPHASKELILKQFGVVKETLEAEYDPDRK
jgi:hypothetical protein